jgi:K+-sensing histidine kinase KdpD
MSQEPWNDSRPVPWPDIVKFVRQLNHDIRNNLNAVELQSAYLAELTENDEIKEEVKRLRHMVSEVGISLQRLTAGLSQAHTPPISYKAADFVEDLRQKVANEQSENANKITWDAQLADETLQVDPQYAQQAFLELFTNAFQHERNVNSIAAKAYIDRGRFVFELHEPKANFQLKTENWGREPLRNVSQGHYGLGLNRARSVIEAHGGELRAEFDRNSSTLKTTLKLPLEKSR